MPFMPDLNLSLTENAVSQDCESARAAALREALAAKRHLDRVLSTLDADEPVDDSNLRSLAAAVHELTAKASEFASLRKVAEWQAADRK